MVRVLPGIEAGPAGPLDELASLFRSCWSAPGCLDGVRARLADPDEPCHPSGRWTARQLCLPEP
ncbi:hypothetical protein ABZ208_17770 [Streptomyces sp. NPDC006208]|uniref:hypothetical protein n=1 Tax=Streptomyces sp. NPDC006208 TaxID=3156734 RepID=UPI0033A25B2E